MSASREPLLLAVLLFNACAAPKPPPSGEVLALREELGGRLFFDTKLSRENNISCASCHQPDKGFSDGLKVSPGTHGVVQSRNTPPLYNLANARVFFWDGRADSLEEQARGPIEGPTEMDLPLEQLEVRLRTDASYVAQFSQAFPGEGLSTDNVLMALAAFERTLKVEPSPYDVFLAGDVSALSSDAQKGLALFEGRALCVRCHKGSDLTDGEFHNTGLLTSDLGRGKFLRDSPSSRGTKGLSPYPFISHYKAFKTPSLRNVALTGPWFHDGSRSSLREVIDFYDRGGDVSDQGKSLHVRPLSLRAEEKVQLEAFLRSLTSEVRSVTLLRAASPNGQVMATRALGDGYLSFMPQTPRPEIPNPVNPRPPEIPAPGLPRPEVPGTNEPRPEIQNPVR